VLALLVAGAVAWGCAAAAYGPAGGPGYHPAEGATGYYAPEPMPAARPLADAPAGWGGDEAEEEGLVRTWGAEIDRKRELSGKQMAGAPADKAAVTVPEKPASEVAGDPAGQPAPVQRKIIYTGWFTVDVYDIPAAQARLIDEVTAMGGYLQQQNGNQLVLRIPAEAFEKMEPKLRELGRVDDSATIIRAQDITEEYYDIELRLKTKKEYLESLRELLEQSGKLEEKLAVQQEIARVVEEIESMEGRLRLLSQLVSYATVTVSFRLAYTGPSRTFRLPWQWMDYLGVEYLVH
jgi:hypothetical protein